MKKTLIFNGLLAALLITAGVEVVVGIILLSVYKGGASTAYGSTLALGHSGAMSFIQGLHHWLSAVLLVGSALTLGYGLLWSAYHEESRKIWVGSVLLMILFLLLQLTGHILPWDQHAVRTAVIESSIAQGAPVIGSLQANLVRGGSHVGPATLSLWYWAHVAIFSIVLLLLALYLAKRVVAGGLSRRYFVGSLSLFLIPGVVLALARTVRMGPEALSADYVSFDAKPEWYVLPLHSLLSIFQNIGPQLAFVGTMVIPGIVVLLVAAAPWLDQKIRHPKGSIYGPALGVVLLLGVGILFAQSAGDMAIPNGPNVASATTPSPAAIQKLSAADVFKGKLLFKEQGCVGCHTVSGSGGDAGPNLDETGIRHPDLKWQMDHLAEPRSVSPGSTMPSYKSIGTDKIRALANYLAALKGKTR